MSDLHDKAKSVIEQTLLEHFAGDPGQLGTVDYCGCDDWEPERSLDALPHDQHAAHVAEQVWAALREQLGLREEHETKFPPSHDGRWMPCGYSTGRTRIVSDWTPTTEDTHHRGDPPMTDRCPWSDLPTGECHHCDPSPRPAPDRGDLEQPATLHVAHPVAAQTHSHVTDAQANRILSKAAHALDRDDPASTLDYVEALTRPTTHHEPYTTLRTNPDGTHYWMTERHRTISLPLLEQLQSAIATTGAIEGGAHAFASKPAARVDAIDVLQDIDTETLAWMRRLHLSVEDKHGRPLTLAQRLQSAAANAGDDMLRDLRSWWIRARTVTGWDSPSWRPDNTCPLCEVKGDLRVRLDARTGVCLGCGEVWDAGTIGLLADHIRQENGESDEADGSMSA